MSESSIGGRRRYDNRGRQQKAARTRERIIAAGTELVHAFDSWNWRELTFRSVAERAGVGERTVYRHFPTERHLHDAVMQRLESEAGISYEDVDLGNLGEVRRLYAWLGEPVTDEFESRMRSWWADNAEKREPHSHADAEAFGIDLDAIRPLFASYVDHSQRWIAHER